MLAVPLAWMFASTYSDNQLKCEYSRVFTLLRASVNAVQTACVMLRLKRARTHKQKRPPLRVAFFAYLMPGSVLLSHGETPHYHRRYGVSLLSSAWVQVVPPRYRRQANSVSINPLCNYTAGQSNLESSLKINISLKPKTPSAL
jgi:hypothetical protein